MSNVPTAANDPDDLSQFESPGPDDVRNYILDMIDQLAGLAAVHGHTDLAMFLGTAPRIPNANALAAPFN